MALTLDLNDLADGAGADVEEQIKKAVGRSVRAVKEAAEDDSRPDFVILHLVEQMASINERLVSGTYTGAGLDALVRKQPLALTGDSSSDPTPDGITADQADQLGAIAGSLGTDINGFLRTAQALFASFSSLSPNQRNARAKLMTDVAEGDFKVKDDGTPVLQSEKAAVEAELATTKTERDTLKSFKDQFSGLEGSPNRDARITAMKEVAAGNVPLDPHGALLLANTHPVVAERDTLKSIIASIKENVEPKGLPGFRHHELDVDGLSDPAKHALGVD